MQLNSRYPRLGYYLGENAPEQSRGVIDQISSAIEKIYPLVQQTKVLNAQLKVGKQIARQNNTYLDTDAIMPPGIQTTVSFAPSSDIKKMFLYGGLGLLVILALNSRKRR